MENFQHTITASLDVFSAGRRLEKECKASRVAHKLSQSVCNERKHKKKKTVLRNEMQHPLLSVGCNKCSSEILLARYKCCNKLILSASRWLHGAQRE